MMMFSLRSIRAVFQRALNVWVAPEKFSRFDLFWFIAINTVIVNIFVGLCAFPYAYFTGAPVWMHFLGGALIATPTSIVLMYLGGNGLRVNLDLRNELEAARGNLERQANQDFLTGLANRRAYTVALSEKFAAEETGFSLMMIDLDGFKKVNDNYGHDAGDAILTGIALRLQKWLEDHNALIARLGGDEFAILMSSQDAETEGGAERFARKLCIYLQVPYKYEDIELSIGASIGLAHVCPQLHDASTLTIAADAALREAKQAGKGRVKVYHSKACTEEELSRRA